MLIPRGPHLLLRALLPRAERDEVLVDLSAEFGAIAAADGERAARRWAWRQALGSAPALLGWTWWRGWTGFEPRANAYRPGGPMLKSWITDARFAARRLRNRPLYTLLAVLTLALGIGGSAAVFGLARPLLLDPLPYAHAGEVGTLWMTGWWTEEEFLFLRGRIPGFRQVAAHRPSDVILRDGEGPTRLVAARQTSWELFDVLGARPMLGRGFREGDDAQGAEPVVVLSYGLWQELGGQQSVVGQRLTLDGEPRTVIGVMPRGFWFPDPAVRLWHARPLNPQGRNGSYALTGRTAPGVSVEAMRPQLAGLAKMLGDRFEYSEAGDKTKEPAVTPLREELLGSMRPALLATLTAMGLILLIACANVAALMLGQVEGRTAELAVRSALGANRGRLTQQLVVEALLVGVLAAVAGGALAAGGFRLLAGALPLGAWSESARFDWTMFAAALALAVGAVLLVVLVPTVSLWRGDLRAKIGSARTGGIQGRGGRMEGALVVTEVALAMLIASGAALLVRSVSNLYAIDPGVRTEGLAVVDVMSSRSLPSAERRQTLDEIARALGALPGVRSVGVAMKLPLRGSGDSFGIRVEGRDADGPGTNTYFRIVTPTYFETMGMRLREGRTFDNSDRLFGPADTANVEMSVLVNEAFVRKHFPKETAIGRRLTGGFNAPQRIVGVVSDVAEAGLTDEDAAAVYYLAGQAPIFGASASLVLNAGSEAAAAGVLDAARGTVSRVAPEFAVQGTTTMRRVLDTAVGPARQIMALLALLSSLALVLGAVGIYGVIAHFAARRKRDWAIKVTLGLLPRRVIGSIVAQGAALVGGGVVIGLAGTAVLARLLESFLFRVGTLDPVAFAAAGAALLLIGLAAALVPAWRAGMLNPSVVLREQ
ncbi:ADOP family duplicated permease [Roseisolibacter sp. H3M3-2]|uniref:ADOP family duplicated permease n=1 Tax=Roseisolibacter sp. H3M3-2 TaxID=3031323 RepID=UPI0023DC7900|nr:ADOP family duplicated permease [Roseisolibacter sp. H3M3-2]MDF1504181.1 ADOP family duplicated permease [Roseisolibacter sp. H3M3-2]